ncbi:MAG: DUF2059 domain-containing protein [Pseudomonadota bacterium]
MTITAIAISALLFVAEPSAAAATATTTAEQIDAERLREAEAYVRGPAMSEMMDQMFSDEGMQGMLAGIMPAGTTDQEDMATALKIASEEMRKYRPRMEDAMIQASAKVFTLEELKAANEFYRSPEGRGMASKTQEFMQTYMELYLPIAQEYMASLMERVSEIQ